MLVDELAPSLDQALRQAGGASPGVRSGLFELQHRPRARRAERAAHLAAEARNSYAQHGSGSEVDSAHGRTHT